LENQQDRAKKII